MKESTLSFELEGETLLGILAEPGRPAETVAEAAGSELGVLVVVGGPQYRAGSHRQFVLLCRHLAAGGFTSLRFDVRGMGDSQGGQRSFEALDADIGAAVTALLAARPRLRRVVLWGLCDGASASLLYLQRSGDPRVAGLCLLNPWLRSTESLARAQVKHYYLQRLLEKGFWLKLLRGGVGAAALRGLLQNLGKAFGSKKASGQAGDQSAAASLGFQDRMALAWRQQARPTLLLLSGRDLTAQEFLEGAASRSSWTGLLQQSHVRRRDLPDADHTLSDRRQLEQAHALTLDWLQELAQKACR